jgi:hypothetical protein
MSEAMIPEPRTFAPRQLPSSEFVPGGISIKEKVLRCFLAKSERNLSFLCFQMDQICHFLMKDQHFHSPIAMCGVVLIDLSI